MEKTIFFVEKKSHIHENHLFLIRKLYLPIIGPVSYTFYTFLLDLTQDQKLLNKPFFYLKDSLNSLNISEHDFFASKKILEATGLLRTYFCRTSKNFYLVILKPLNFEKFNKNKFLKFQLIKKIGDVEFENLYLKLKTSSWNKENLEETSVKFSDIFDIKEQEKINISTAEMDFNKNISLDEAIVSLPSILFIKYLTKKTANLNEINLINFCSKLGFMDSSINLIINYSFIKNSKIVVNFIKKIASDFAEKNLLRFEDIKFEFNSILDKSKQAKDLWDYSESIVQEIENPTLNVKKSNFKKSVTSQISFHDLLDENKEVK